jgi:hypothetical protein
MTTDNPFLDALHRLASSAPTVVNDLVVHATELADTLANHPGTVAREDETLEPFNEQLDLIIAQALAVVVGGSNYDQRAVVLALEALAGVANGPQRVQTPGVLAVLARATLCVTGGALAWRRLELVEQLATVRHTDGYGQPVSIVADTDLRHLDLYARGADTSFNAHLTWLKMRPWRAAVGVLCSDDALALSLAEADVLGGMLAVGEGRERDQYSAGLALGDRRVQDRIVARARDPRQRAVLVGLFGVGDDALDDRMSDAFAGLSVGQRMTSFRRGLFAAD